MYHIACVASRQDVVEVIDPAKDLGKPVLRDFTKIPGRYGLVIKDLEQGEESYGERVLYQVFPLNPSLHLD